MVRGWDMRYIRAAFYKLFTGDSLLVKRYSNALYMVRRIDFWELVIAGVFHRKAKLATQKLNQQIIKVVRSRADYDLLRLGIHSSRSVKIIADCRAEFLCAAGWYRLQQRCSLFQNYRTHKSCPHGERKQVVVYGFFLNYRLSCTLLVRLWR